MSEKTPAIQVEGLTVKAGEKYLLKDIGFELYSGDVLGLIGETGSGKTVQDVNHINRQFYHAKHMMKQVKKKNVKRRNTMRVKVIR